eukprot:scaffold69692_cov32-Tisochrysis_lutea.AAC.1
MEDGERDLRFEHLHRWSIGNRQTPELGDIRWHRGLRLRRRHEELRTELERILRYAFVSVRCLEHPVKRTS